MTESLPIIPIDHPALAGHPDIAEGDVVAFRGTCRPGWLSTRIVSYDRGTRALVFEVLDPEPPSAMAYGLVTITEAYDGEASAVAGIDGILCVDPGVVEAWSAEAEVTRR
jgi:hypothetical protein